MEDLLQDVGYRYQEAFGANDITSSRMKRAIGQWFRLYYGDGEGGDPCLQLPYTVVRKLTRAVFSEYRAESEGAFTQNVLKGLAAAADNGVQMALIGGESYLKPVLEGEQWRFQVIDRRNLLVFGRDVHGELTDVGLVERSVWGRFYYTLLERRYVDGGDTVLENRLYRAPEPGTLGSPVPLRSHPLYAALPERFRFPQKLGGVGLVRLRNPAANCVDGSNEGVSVYAPAVGLIRNLSRNEAQLSGEFERGQSRIVVSADMLRDGQLRDSVFVGLDESPADVGITVFSPALREQSYLNRKQAYLRDVENVIGLKRGLLSQVEATQRTATEITSSQGEYALAIMDFQRMWQRGVQQAVGLCRTLGMMYGMEVDQAPVQFHWGNGVLFDQVGA